MTVDERIQREYGSTIEGLQACIASGMSNADIGRKYECSDKFIGRKLKQLEIENPNDGRKRIKPVNEESILGITHSVARKAMTAAMVNGEEYYRQRLRDQMAHYKPDHPEFEAVCADIMKQRETCRPQLDHKELIWKDYP